MEPVLPGQGHLTLSLARVLADTGEPVCHSTQRVVPDMWQPRAKPADETIWSLLCMPLPGSKAYSGDTLGAVALSPSLHVAGHLRMLSLM